MHAHALAALLIGIAIGIACTMAWATLTVVNEGDEHDDTTEFSTTRKRL